MQCESKETKPLTECEQFQQIADLKLKLQIATSQCETITNQNHKLQSSFIKHRAALRRIKSYSPACCYDKTCPANGGEGYDHGCVYDKCSFLIATQALKEDRNISSDNSDLIDALQDFIDSCEDNSIIGLASTLKCALEGTEQK